MKPVQRIELTHAVPIDGRGHRTRQTELAISERDKLLVEAARFYPDMSDRAVARLLRAALLAYRNGRWRRDRIELTCPIKHKNKLVQVLWMILKTRDAIPSERTIRAALSRMEQPRQLGSLYQ
jgi:hypothetical protein